MLLSKAWELYELDKRIEGFSPQTIKAYRLQSNLLIHHFNDVNIESVTTDQLKEYLAYSSEHLKPSSLAHRIRFIKSIFRWSHKEGHIPKNSAVSIFIIRCEIWIKRYLDLRQDQDPAIFVTERHPQKMSIAQMRYIIKRISSRAGINKEIHPHQLRHSYATHY